MATTLTNGTDTVTPVLVTGYESARETQTVVHRVIGRADPDISLRPAALRTGTLELLFDSETDAEAAELAHAQAAIWTLTDFDRSTVGMSYVVADGSVTRTLDDETRTYWTVAVPFVEVST